MKIKGFTPVFDSLVKQYDTNTALVYGKIWRICDWSPLGICSMGNERIAEELGLSEKTIRRKKEILAEDGLIKVVGKSGIADSVTVCHEIVMSMEIADPSDNLSETLVKLSKTADSLTDKDSIRKKEDIIDDGAAIHASIVGEARRLFKLTPNWNTKVNQDHYRFFRERYDAGQRMGTFARWWFEESWQGQQGQYPTLTQIREKWYQAFEPREEEDPYKNVEVVE